MGNAAVTFAAVATEAKVSLSYLYEQPALASEIRQRRLAGRAQPRLGRISGRGPASPASLRATRSAPSSPSLRTGCAPLEREVRDPRTENQIFHDEVLDLRRHQHRTPGGTASRETRP